MASVTWAECAGQAGGVCDTHWALLGVFVPAVPRPAAVLETCLVERGQLGALAPQEQRALAQDTGRSHCRYPLLLLPSLKPSP